MNSPVIPARGARLVGGVIGRLSLVLCLLIVIGELGILAAGAFGHGSERTQITLSLTGVLLPYALLICLTASDLGKNFSTLVAADLVLSVPLFVLAVAPQAVFLTES